MLQHWTIFEGMPNGKRREMARVTLGPNRALVLNGHAYNAMGEPRAVEMMFDANRNMIGLRPCDPHKKNAFVFKQSKQGKHVQLSIGAFLTHLDIKPTRTILFEEIDITAEGILSLDMTKTTIVSRGSR